MHARQIALAAALAATALSVQAGPRMESAVSPFTYEALGATPVVTFGRASTTKPAEAPVAAPAPKEAAASKAAASLTTGSAGAASSTFTYDTLGATPHVEVRKQPARSQVQAPASAH